MFDFSYILDLPMIWGGLIGTAIFLYVLLDGFDLGLGILLPFAPSNSCRNCMINSIAPFWDGNETWLILGGGGLFAAFPLAYSILMPAFYIPIISMLLGLIMRGVAFEFRFKSENHKPFWECIFHFGSLIAAFCQGVILGAFVQGIAVEGRNFSGDPLSFASAFSIMTGIAVVCGYALLGATWLIMKSENVTQTWARKAALYVLAYVAFFMGLVSVVMPLMNANVQKLWFSTPNIYYLFLIPLLTLLLFVTLWKDLTLKVNEYRPFFASIGLFLMGYLGLAISLYPWIVPFKVTLWDAAASNPSLSLLLVGVVPTLPFILGFTGYCYYVFRGKSTYDQHY